MIRVGIFFGGSSREREIAFAGGRTVYDNLDKSLFEPVPIFVDSQQRLILLDWSYLYKGSIRDFYPPVEALPPSSHGFQIYAESLPEDSDWAAIMQAVGRPLDWSELPQILDFAFLSLHGSFGEDGQIQGLLEALHIPYSGSGIRASSIGMDKGFQKRLMEAAGFATPRLFGIRRSDYLRGASPYVQAAEEIGYPLVVRPANQGSSIGVSIVESAEDLSRAIEAAFFMRRLDLGLWASWEESQKIRYLRDCCDLRSGIGLPVLNPQGQLISHPETLWTYLDQAAAEGQTEVLLQGLYTEQQVLLEGFIRGREFSCVVIRQSDGSALALPPTEIRKGQEVFDYRAKYLAGLASKVTPMQVEEPILEAIAAECCRLFAYLDFQVYARIDGFLGEDGLIYLNDPNTTSGMLPSSFFFHQAAEIGLNPSQFLTYIIETSLRERQAQSPILGAHQPLLERLDQALRQGQAAQIQKQRVAVLLGGYSSERHISVESGRNIYEKLASSAEYRPIPVFVAAHAQEGHCFYALPIHLLLKDNADDILEKIQHYAVHPFVAKQRLAAEAIRQRFAAADALQAPEPWTYADLAAKVDQVFIALHGRPGEDGQVQSRLQRLGLPFNGSEAHSAALTIDKYETLRRLREAGFPTAAQFLHRREAWERDAQGLIAQIEAELNYPFIAKPVDDGCSSAVKKIKNRAELEAFLALIFRQSEALEAQAAKTLGLQPKEEFPQKELVLLESLIEAEGAAHFLEITGGLLSYYDQAGELQYLVFEPSETPAAGEVLSLEEKFLAGEGQNLTPARLSGATGLSHENLSAQVRAQLERAARLLGVSGYARIDAFVRVWSSGQAEVIVIEVNSLPGMTPATCIFHQAALANYKPFDFIQAILRFGQARQLKQAGPILQTL